MALDPTQFFGNGLGGQVGGGLSKALTSPGLGILSGLGGQGPLGPLAQLNPVLAMLLERQNVGFGGLPGLGGFGGLGDLLAPQSTNFMDQFTGILGQSGNLLGQLGQLGGGQQGPSELEQIAQQTINEPSPFSNMLPQILASFQSRRRR